MKDVQTLSEGRLKLSTGTLYGALKRLLEQGWVQRVDDPAPDNTLRQRKAYALAERGRRALKAEAARLQRLVGAAQLRVAEERR
jgi:DNA-binding PadR family transcriptional regulator